jgi:DNA-binding SARP family transcriptional activator
LLQFRILGPLEVADDDLTIRLGGPKQRSVLALLLLNANRVVSVDRLADELYAGAAPVTAVTQVQRQISDLRKLLGPSSGIETRPPGYLIRLRPEQLDLNVFERSSELARIATARGEFRKSVALLDDALALFRGAPMDDLAHEQFARPAIARLQELQIAAREQRGDVLMELGHIDDAVRELETMLAEHPLRESVARRLMIGLYRADRQADALAVYRRTRQALVQQLGLEPTAALREAERSILAHDPKLDPAKDGVAADRDSVIVAARSGDDVDRLLSVALPLASRRGHELIVTCFVEHEHDVEPAAAQLTSRRDEWLGSVRIATLTRGDVAADVVRLTSIYDADLVLLAAPPGIDGERLPPDVASLFASSTCDVALLAGSAFKVSGAGITVPFAGAADDWSALELASWLAASAHVPLRLIGTGARRGRRDASRLLADASVAVQRVVGIAAVPVVAEPTEKGLLAATAGSDVIVVGVAPRWRADGVGATRRALLRESDVPVLLVRGGARPGVLAPREARTRFTWSIAH